MQNNFSQLLHCKSVDQLLTHHSAQTYHEKHINTKDKTQQEHDRNIIPTTNFNFQTVEQKIYRPPTINRIHAKTATKRTGGKVVLFPQKQKKDQHRPNSPKKHSPARCQQFRKSQCKSIKQAEQEDPSNLMVIKSYQTQARMSYADPTVRSSQRNLSNFTDQNPSSNQVLQIFKDVKRRLEGDLQFQRTQQKKKKCFYNNLKRKLQIEIKQTSQQKHINHMNLLIEGCHAVQHFKPQRTNTSNIYNQTGRPKTTTPRSSVAKDNKENYGLKRPKSCRCNGIESPRNFKQMNNQSEVISFKTKKEKETHKTRATVSHLRSPRSNSSLHAAVSKQKKEHELSDKLQQTSNKLAQIINDCNSERTFSDLKVNMKTFQFYCKRLNQGFQLAQRKLQEVQVMEID